MSEEYKPNSFLLALITLFIVIDIAVTVIRPSDILGNFFIALLITLFLTPIARKYEQWKHRPRVNSDQAPPRPALPTLHAENVQVQLPFRAKFRFLPSLNGNVAFTIPKEDDTEANRAALLNELIRAIEELDPPLHTSHYTIASTTDYEEHIRQRLAAIANNLHFTSFAFSINCIQPDEAIYLGFEAQQERASPLHFLPYESRTRHVYIAGKTQHGKSTLMLCLAALDMSLYRGVGVIDPHGDLVEKLMRWIPEPRVKDAVYLDASNPVPIDLMSYANEREKEALVGDIIFLLQRFPGWGPRMDAILRNTLYTLLEARNTSFLDIYHFLVNERRRKEILASVKDADLQRYWRDNFPKSDALDPIISRMTTFVRSPSLTVFMGTPSAKLNIYDLMQEGKILLVNLAKSGRESGDILGSLIVSKIQQAAARRQDIDPGMRKPFYLYADEFERFQTSSFDIILSEAGKFRLCLTMANQFVDQLQEPIISSIIGNVSTFILFRMDEKDARHFSGAITQFDIWAVDARNPKGRVPMPANALSNLPPGLFLYRSAEGKATLLEFVDPGSKTASYAEIIRKRTVEQYGCMEPERRADDRADDDILPSEAPKELPSHKGKAESA